VSSDETGLRVERSGAVVRLLLDRPASMNSLHRPLILALAREFESASSDTSVRAITLSGTGGAFCSGIDLARVNSDGSDFDKRIDELHSIIRCIARTPKPVIAGVDGGAVGFGADLALVCDLRVLSQRGYIQEKFVGIGLMPDGGGTYLLPRLVGVGRALEYLMLGTKLEAPRALELGLATRVVPEANFDEELAALARQLAEGPALALAQIKQSVRVGTLGELDAALDREKAGQLRLLASKDLSEGVRAFAEKRKPNFRGE
jgi:2-(1,2-epoxy-1,2-dihydrophenyl)acetyl-CoA isomerase